MSFPALSVSPAKKLEPSPERLLTVALYRWRDEAAKAGRTITRIALAFEAGRDGFWLARWLAARGVEAHVIHPSSVAVSREHRRAKTDRLDTELLSAGSWGGCEGNGAIAAWCACRRLPKRTPSGPIGSASAWSRNAPACEPHEQRERLRPAGIRNFKPTLRNAAEHLAALHTPEGSPLPPNVAAELERDIARLGLVISQIKQVEEVRRQRLEEQPESRPHGMVRLLARVVGIGTETADMLVNEVLSRPLRDRRSCGALRRPDGCAGRERREAAGTRARQSRQCPGPPGDDPTRLALLRFQKDSALARWYQARTVDRRAGTRKTMIVALALQTTPSHSGALSILARRWKVSSYVQRAEKGLPERAIPRSYSALALAFSALPN